MNKKPAPGDYAPYAEQYVVLVNSTDIVDTLKTQLKQTATLFSGRGERDGNFRYAPDKWTVKEVFGHVADTERIFAYRALRIARGDKTPLEGFEQEDFVRAARFNERSFSSILDEYADVRRASVALFSSLDDEAWQRRGIASKNPVTVLALAYLIAGHELHHRKILNEVYFPAIPRA
ncbi:MAG TPA: DinB family protein [Candidatus Acidoferrales bacterium]|nr:DinB family protein [Candidatus Acidoferrales bacterium]